MLIEAAASTTRYAPGQDVPLAGYAATMATYAGLLGLALVGVSRRRARWQPGPLDTALLGVATHKLSRIVTKDFVTSPLRAPFTERRDAEGAGEVHDEPRQGQMGQMGRSVGYLLTCPYCVGPWLATGLGTLLWLRPAPTRFVLRMLSAVTISDFLHLAYSTLNERRKVAQLDRRQAEQN